MAGNLTAMIASIFSGGVTPDPYYEYTTLLLPGNGTNGAQNNTFLDASTNNFTITRNGNTTQGTFSPFSQTGWGNYFSGGANYLNVAAASSIDLASSDFTIECWAYPGTQTNSVDSVFGYGGFTTMLYRNGTTWSWEVGNGSSANYFTITATVTPNAWQHIALTRSGNTFTFWLNGVSANTNSTTNAVGTASKNLTIGYNNGVPNAQYFTGYISNFRIVKGTAVYTSTFTPPTVPLTAITNTSLLTCQSNRFIDTNTQLTAKTITLTGSPSVVAFSPFNPTASWSATTNGGSGYFDGTGDYLSAASNAAFNLSSNAFCVEAWFYPTVSTGQILTWSVSSTGIEINLSSNNVLLDLGSGSSWFISSANCGTALLNAWNHVAIVKNSSGNIGGFVNGTRGYSTTNTTAIGNANTFVSVGAGRGSSNYFTGYISNLRYVNGTAVYDPTQTTLTVPTAPLTAITNTSLLLNYTNAGIYDATSKNDLETVGNSQISTTQYKFPPSSMYFDGTADYLLPNGSATNMFTFGTGDFTVEFWMNAISFADPGNIKIIFDCRPLSTDGLYPCIYFYSGQIRYFVNNADRITGSTLSTSQWYHIALSRSGTNTKLFVDGTQVGSTYTDSNNYLCGANRPSIGCRGFNLGDNNYYGYMQDVRITKGYARYTANFTAPTAAFPTL